ncbi:MAG TPA: exodeoxyribonuclease III [Rhodocyclaceae bacterium]|nr:MAG: exodeoxyribonuclease III [Betaproteobacteria bacterium CG2_30_68_42]PIX75124.1 MAG: exodeoxyribonuclease III [Rhodocyclales bacterium CG_4_10_14_3_um_filter_68_10]HCX33248.1 exodeoxyribonuclease III [Rhodocyclaceae bacterium]
MKIATWNVNSLKVRLPQVLEWLALERPDVLCLQETKVPDEAFPSDALAHAGYSALFAGQKTYNGVAVLATHAPTLVATGIPGFADEQKRLIAADCDGIRIVCAYFPNGQAVGSDKFAYKLAWIAALTGWLRSELAKHPEMLLLGDLNIAPEDRDVHDPKAWEGQVLCSEPERAAFRALTALGFADGFRLFEQPERAFTWWDYRMAAFRRNLGLRIDHVLVAPALVPRARACRIDPEPRRAERPSDHAPVILELG